jgi:flotillin
MGTALVLLLVFSLLLIGAPIGLNIAGYSLGPMSTSIMVGSGIALAVVCTILFTITKLYVKTKASEAFVRTGMGGLKVIRDGGAIVLPVVHEIVRVSLETIRLEVLRRDDDALITYDKLRADIKAEFFIQVQPTDDAIKAASRSLGDKMNVDTRSRINDRGDSNKSVVSLFIEDKLVNALRTAASRKTLEQLNSERDEFLKEVVAVVSTDLSPNGFTLESVTISRLDQTDEKFLKANNIFDSQGMKTTAEITQRNLTEKNKIVREGEQARTAQDVETRKKVLELDRSRVEAEATQASQIAMAQAEQERLAKEKQLEAARSVEVAGVEQQKAIEIAKRVQQQAIEVAERDKQQAVVQADQKVEVAKRSQLEAVAVADAKKAKAESNLAEAEAERQRARQGIVTVEKVAEADRNRQTTLLNAEAEAGKALVTAQKAADAKAYGVKTEADARKASADADAEATKKKAAAEAEAMRLQAEGQKAQQLAQAEGSKAQQLAQAEGQRAIAMVPVDVKAREVEVDQKRVAEVLKPELQARGEFGAAAQQFELAKFQIQQEALVRIESSKAMASIALKGTFNVYGTPEDVAKMNALYAQGMGWANVAGGFFSAADDNTTDVVKKAMGGVESLVQSVSGRVKGTPPETKP